MKIEEKPLLAVPDLSAQPKAPQPALYETDASKYAGPHKWQILPAAKVVRRVWRRRAYTQWFDKACTDVELVGRHNLNHLSLDRGAVIVANHQSHLDTIIINETLPASLRKRVFFGAAQDRWFVRGKKKLALKPWYQSLALGNFPIMRGGGSGALSHASWLLERGQCVMLFPEGTRSMGEELGQFRHGATLLALKHDVPVIPIYLGGLQSLRAKKQREVKPGPAYVEFLRPIQFAANSHVAAATATLERRLGDVHKKFSERLDSGLWQPSSESTGNDASNAPERAA